MQVEVAEVEVDRPLEAVRVAEPAGHPLDPLNPPVDRRRPPPEYETQVDG